jgi:hypothetical protein
MTITAGRGTGGLTAHRGPKVYITDNAGGYDRAGIGGSLKERGQGLLTVATETNVPAIQIIHTGTASEPALEVLKKNLGANNSDSMFSVKPSETVVNESSAAYDFRVESNAQTNMLYVDGTNNRVAIGNNAPMGALDVNDMGGTYTLVLRKDDNSGVASNFMALGVGGNAQAYFTGSNGNFHFFGGSNTKPSAAVYIAGKEHSNDTGDSRLWFSTLNSTDSKTDVYHMGYDRSDQKFILGKSSTWNAGAILTVNDDQVIINSGSQDLDFIVQSDDYTHTFMVDANNNKVYIGEETIAPNLTDSTHGKLTVSHARTDTWDMTGGSSNQYNHFNLVLRNETVTTNAFAGIAFDVSTETTDADSIGAAILATRDTAASSTATLHDTNLVFATSDLSDDDLTERMRITHDGKVIIGNGLGSDYSGGTGCMLLSSTANAAADVGNPGNYHLYINHGANTNSNAAGIAFSVSESIDDVGAAIIHTRTGNESKGTLSLYVKDSTVDQADPIEALAIAATGNITTSGTVTTGGDIQVNGNDVRDSGGNSVITFGGSSGAQFNGHLKILRTLPVVSLRDSDATTDAEFCGYIDFYRGDGTSRVGWLGYGTTTNTSLTINNETSDGVIYFATDTGTALTINNDMTVSFHQMIVGDYSGNLTMQSDDGYVWVRSQTHIYMDLDEDSDDTSSYFRVRNGANSDLFLVEESTGDVGIGVSPSQRLHVYDSTNDSIGVVRIQNGHSNSGCDLMYMEATGQDAHDYDGNIISARANGGSVWRKYGNGAGGSTETNSFTAGHDTVAPLSSDLVPGMIVESTGEIWFKPTDKNYETGLPKCRLSDSANSKSVFGVVNGFSESEDRVTVDNENYVHNGWIMTPSFPAYGQLAGIPEGHIQFGTMSLGEGVIWVTNIAGDIENGDYIVSSIIMGHGAKQADDIMRSCTVAKCTETIPWETVTDTITHDGQVYKKYLAICTFHCG